MKIGPGGGARRRSRAVLIPALVTAAGLVGCASSGGSSNRGGGDGEGAAAVSVGKRIASQRGCANCHTTDGRRSVGPTWKGIFGTTVTLDDGSSVVVDEAYVERSIRDPSAQIVEGFSVPMPRIALGDDEVAAMVEYIRSLS